MSNTPDFQFLTDKILGLLEKHHSGMLIDDVVAALNRPRSSCRNTLFRLRALGCVEMKYIAQYTFIYKFIKHIDRTGRPKNAAPVSIISRPVFTPVRNGKKPQSGTGIITPSRQPQPFRPLQRRDFYLAQRLAELTR